MAAAAYLKLQVLLRVHRKTLSLTTQSATLSLTTQSATPQRVKGSAQKLLCVALNASILFESASNGFDLFGSRQGGTLKGS
jgi:hypothetical protein